MYFHDDQTAELQHRILGQATRTVVYRQIIWKVRAELRVLGITEDGWIPPEIRSVTGGRTVRSWSAVCRRR
jgi:hypothetical protein